MTGEGGSGGALAIGVGNRVLMLEYAIYSVISPEGCAAILWGDAAKAPEAAELMRVTAPDLLKLGVIDAIVPEPVGGAHRNWEATAASLRAALRDQLWQLKSKSERRADRGAPREVPPDRRLRGDRLTRRPEFDMPRGGCYRKSRTIMRNFPPPSSR